MPVPTSSLRWKVPDHEGNDVCLYQEQWDHVLRRHPEMRGHERCLRLAIFDPEIVVRTPHRARYADGERRTLCKLGAHPHHAALYVMVPIEYGADGHNFVVTAHVGPLPPKGDLIYVRLPIS